MVVAGVRGGHGGGANESVLWSGVRLKAQGIFWLVARRVGTRLIFNSFASSSSD